MLSLLLLLLLLLLFFLDLRKHDVTPDFQNRFTTGKKKLKFPFAGSDSSIMPWVIHQKANLQSWITGVPPTPWGKKNQGTVQFVNLLA